MDVYNQLKFHLPARESRSSPVHLLEIASGTGQHAAYMAPLLPDLGVWVPSDISSDAIERDIPAWTSHIPQVAAPIALDASSLDWPRRANSALQAASGQEHGGVPPSTDGGAQKSLPSMGGSTGALASTGFYDAILACNVTHISPFDATEGLFAGAAKALRPGGRLCIYGPFKLAGTFTTASNREFDGKLRERDPSWGLRNLEDLDRCAAIAGLTRIVAEPMPANNFFCVWELQIHGRITDADALSRSTGTEMEPARSTGPSGGSAWTETREKIEPAGSAGPRGWKLELIPGNFSVAKLPRSRAMGVEAEQAASVAAAIRIASVGVTSANSAGPGSLSFFSVAWTEAEVSLVTSAEALARLQQGEHTDSRDRGAKETSRDLHGGAADSSR